MKKTLAAIACIALVLGISGCNETNKLSKYDWGEELQKKLDGIGVDSIKSVKDETSEATKGMVANVVIETENKNIDALLNKNTDGSWEVLSITDSNDNKIYYELDHLQKNTDGTQKDNIYDYKTGNLTKEGKEKQNSSKDSGKNNNNIPILSKDELKTKAKELLSSYDVISIDILTHSEDMQYIVSVQLNANVDEDGAKKISKEISDKIKTICKYYSLEIDNNYKLVLLTTQDDFK